MKITTNRFVAPAAVALLCALSVRGANAQCGRGVASLMIWPSAQSQQMQKIHPLARTPDSDETPAGASIIGLWKVSFIAGGQVVDVGIDAWHSDGTETLNDAGAPTTGGNFCLGVWTKTGGRTYKLKHPGWRWDAPGNLIGNLVLREQITVAADGNTFVGSFTVDYFDLGGNVVFHGEGEVTGERIVAD